MARKRRSSRRRSVRRGGRKCPLPKGVVIKHIKMPHSRKKVARAVRVTKSGKWKFVKMPRC